MNQWEVVAEIRLESAIGRDVTQRLRIDGGWLYRNTVVEEGDQPGVFESNSTICFVPENR